MSKTSSDIELGPYVLDLSVLPAKNGKSQCPIIERCDKESAAGAGGKKKTAFFSFKKIIAFFALAAVLNASTFAMSVWKKFEALKSTAFSASAMSEENIEAIEKLLGVIKYLPATGEAKKIKELAADFENFKNILGFDRPKKYLLVFQNPSEARASGGFIGSVGILEVQAGKIKSVKLKDVYGLDGQLKVQMEPPDPIKKISAAWSLHDSNWFFDFPVSAEKISWFYEKTGGETTDGVIAFNPKVVEDILRITGPIKIPEYGAELNENNFIETAQAEVELNYDKTINRPKLFLADLLAKLRETVESLPLDKKIIIMKNLIANMDEKDIQAVFRNESAQSFIRSHNWDGRISDTEKDYLAAVHSNINGFKTDAVIDEIIGLTTEISDDGSVVDTLRISRVHKGGAGDAGWYDKVNSDYLRVFVPAGSELLNAEGVTKAAPFLKDPLANYKEYLRDGDLLRIRESKSTDDRSGVEIFKESDKTVFGSWVYVSPGERVEISYKYRLPFRVTFDKASGTGIYSLLFQKQSGSRVKNISQKIIFPSSWKAVGNYSEDFIFRDGRIERVIDARSDKFTSVLFAKGASKN